MNVRKLIWLPAVAAALAALTIACGDDDDTGATATGTGAATGSASAVASSTGGIEGGDIVVYSGRSEALVGPILERFEEETGIAVSVKYGDTAELAALLAEEGGRSPADVYFAQDAGALGAVGDEDLLEPLPAGILDRVDARYKSRDGLWVGVSGRARVIAYNPDNVDASEIPESVLGLVDEKWKGRVGWAPTNGSFQSFVTALRQLEGEDAARDWLEAMIDNDVQEYPNNVSIVEAVAAGEIDLGLVNHYYLYGLRADQGEDFNAENHFLGAGDAGSLVNVAGVGILASSEHHDAALALVDFLLSEEAQHYFSEETYEYPLIDGVEPTAKLTPLSELDPPDIDLSDLDDLEGTLNLLRETGALP